MCQIPDGQYYWPVFALLAGIKCADFNIPQTAVFDRPWLAATQAASLCTYISA